MKTKITKTLLFFCFLTSQHLFSQSKGIRYQYANVTNVVQPNIAGNNSSTFEIGNGDVMVHTPYLTLAGLPNIGYSALTRFDSNLCYLGSKLIPYSTNSSSQFLNAISKNDGGFAINSNSKPYIVRNYESNGKMIFSVKINDSNLYNSIPNNFGNPKMVAHPDTNNLYLAYLEHSTETNDSIYGFKGSPIINFVQISNTTGNIVSTFKCQIDYVIKHFYPSFATVNTWIFDSEINDIKYIKGFTSSQDRIWLTVNLRHQGSYLLDQNSNYSITSNQVSGLFPDGVYSCVISVPLNGNYANSTVGLLPLSKIPKIIESMPANSNTSAEIMLLSLENLKPVIYKYNYSHDPIPNNRYEFPFTVNKNWGDIKLYQNKIFFSFERSFGTFDKNNLQINLRRQQSGFPILSNIGTINYHTRNTNSLYLNYNNTTASGAPTNFLIKQSLSDYTNTCFSNNFSNSLAIIQPYTYTIISAIGGNKKPLSGITLVNEPYGEITNNSIMTTFLQCNVGPCVPPQNKVGNVENENSILTLSPNPASNYFEVSGDDTVQQIAVYSLLGQLVKTYEKQEQYSVADIAKGTYIVKITSSEGVTNKTLKIE